MKLNMKKTVKFAGVVCAAAGVVALSAVAASSAAVIAVKEGIKTAKDTMQKLMAEKKQEAAAEDASQTVVVPVAETEGEPEDVLNADL